MVSESVVDGAQVVKRPVPEQAGAVVAKVNATCQGLRSFQQTRCLLITGLVVLVLAGLFTLADWMWVLSTLSRGEFLLLMAGTAVLVWRRLVPSARKLSCQNAADDIETAFPQLGQRVRTTLEYAEPTPDTMPAAPGLVQALAVDTKRRTQDLDFLSLVPWRFLRWLVVGLAFLVLLYLIGLGSGRELRTAALRLLLIPVHYTQLEVEPGHHTLKAGQDLTVRVLLKGRPVAAVEIQYRPRDGGEEWTRLPLEPPVADAPGSPDTREATVKDCQQDLEYRVLAGPLTSKTYQVTVLRPLVLEAIEAAIEPPAYTRRPATMVKEGNFKVIEGSRVRFRIRLDRPVQTAQLLFATVGRSPKPRENLPPLELSMEGQDLLGELAEVRKEVEYEIFAEAADGMRWRRIVFVSRCSSIASRRSALSTGKAHRGDAEHRGPYAGRGHRRLRPGPGRHRLPDRQRAEEDPSAARGSSPADVCDAGGDPGPGGAPGQLPGWRDLLCLRRG